MQYQCKVCGYIYNDAEQKVPFAELPDTWVCPVCGAPKSAFVRVEEKKETTEVQPEAFDTELKELSAGELSVVFSNLARGCEKQYQAEAQKLFTELSSYFHKVTPVPENPTLDKLSELIRRNLEEDYKKTRTIAQSVQDRGTQRICVWGEKVTTMIALLLDRYKKEGESFLAHTDVWVCTVCGFIYVGDKAPALCPVCKVPDWKFEKIEGGLR